MENSTRNFPLKFVRVIRKGNNSATLTEISEINEGDTGFLNNNAVIIPAIEAAGGQIDLAALDRDLDLPNYELGHWCSKRNHAEDVGGEESFYGLCRFTIEFLAPDLTQAQVSQETQAQLLHCGAVLRESNFYTGCQVVTQVLVPYNNMTTEELWYVTKTARALYVDILGIERLLTGVQKLGCAEDPMDYLMDAYDQELVMRAKAQKKLKEFFAELNDSIPQLVVAAAAKMFPKE